MNYKEVLFPYHPLEQGDFMYRYYINNREYIIYSPEKDKISCLELYNFKELSSFQLAVYIQRIKTEQEEISEFSFEQICSKEDLMKYLFDIAGDKTLYRKIRGVSNCEAYLLYDIKQSSKVRNIYHFNPANNDYQLVFDNDICIASIYDEIRNKKINVCWNPVTYKYLEEEVAEKNTSYLIASSNPILCADIIKKSQDRAASICLYCNDNSLDGLLFFSYYINNKDIEKKIEVYSESNKVTILMKKWYPNILVRFISRIQKIYNMNIRKYYGMTNELDMTVYQLLSISGLSFITFPNDELAISLFLKEVIAEYNLPDIICEEY